MYERYFIDREALRDEPGSGVLISLQPACDRADHARIRDRVAGTVLYADG